MALDENADEPGIHQIPGRDSSPEFAALLADEYRRLLEMLPVPCAKTMVKWKMRGCSDDEIGRKVGKVNVVVQRKLRMVYSVWSGWSPSLTNSKTMIVSNRNNGAKRVRDAAVGALAG